MRTFLLAMTGFVLGAFASVAVLFGIYISMTASGFRDFEGATGMGMLSMSPIIGLVAGIAGAFLLPWWAGRPRHAPTP